MNKFGGAVNLNFNLNSTNEVGVARRIANSRKINLTQYLIPINVNLSAFNGVLTGLTAGINDVKITFTYYG